jgi:hypothetical protein
MSKKVKAKVSLGPVALERVTIAPEMAARLNPTGTITSGTT